MIGIIDYGLGNLYSVLNALKKSARLYRMKIIFIGDRNQLPPVNEQISSVFEMDYGENMIKLDKIL